MAMILGKKIGMTQIYDESGTLVSVTVIQAGPCTVTQVKTQETDQYDAVQMGYDDVKASRQKKPQVGHAQKANSTPKRFVREERLSAPASVQPGDQIDVSLFEEVKFVDVTGISKGKGFQGVMKRHGFKGMDASHGCERKHRHPGSIGSNAAGRGTARCVRKGKRMSGHMGSVRCTSKKHKVMGIDKDNNLLIVKGSIVGSNDGYVVVKQSR